MNTSTFSNRQFLAWAAVVFIVAGFGLALSWPTISNARHHLTNTLVSRGTGKSGEAEVAWYELAHVVSPNDPAVGLTFAKAQFDQGATNTAAKLLSRYPDYLPAAEDRGEILVQQEKFDQAIAVLQPVAGRLPTCAYWLAVAQSEAGQGRAALATLNPDVTTAEESAALLRDLLLVADGQAPDAAVSSPETAEALSQAQSGIIPLALQLYRLGLLNTSERVLTTNHQTSLPAWTLEGQIALSHPTPATLTAEDDYYQAFLLDPTNVTVRTQLQSLATELKDQSTLNIISQVQSQLPTR